jgi:hypothetical protein
VELAEHLKRIEEVLTFHLLFPTAGPVNKDRAALVSLRAIAEHIGVEMESLPEIGDDYSDEEEAEWDALFAQPHVQAGLDLLEQPLSNAEQMREAARTYNERKRR